MLSHPPALARTRIAALAVASAAILVACAPRATVTRRDATPAERGALVECASAIVTAEGFTVTERRKDLGTLSAASATSAAARAPAGMDLVSVAIARHPVTEGLAVRVSASSHSGDSTRAPSNRAAVARDRIISRCAYLVG